jgi:hypothetical protein
MSIIIFDNMKNPPLSPGRIPPPREDIRIKIILEALAIKEEYLENRNVPAQMRRRTSPVIHLLV